ncbi:hypothetical protein [Helicobacter sp. T3_23-1056]
MHKPLDTSHHQYNNIIDCHEVAQVRFLAMTTHCHIDGVAQNILNSIFKL